MLRFNNRFKSFALAPVLLLMVLLLAVSGRADAQVPTQSVPINWGPWRLNANIESNGLSLTSVRYNNRLVLYKANMPVIRVLYIEQPAANISRPSTGQARWSPMSSLTIRSATAIRPRAPTQSGTGSRTSSPTSARGKTRRSAAMTLTSGGSGRSGHGWPDSRSPTPSGRAAPPVACRGRRSRR